MEGAINALTSKCRAGGGKQAGGGREGGHGGSLEGRVMGSALGEGLWRKTEDKTVHAHVPLNTW